jgi:pyruvate formate lyase activating enzyme
MLKRLIDECLVDYVAMDIKAHPAGYGRASGCPDIDIHEIDRSTRILMASPVDYEFRTTFVPGIHSVSDIAEIGKWLDGAKRFVIQGFRPGKTLDPEYMKMQQPPREELRKAADLVQGNFREVIIRD